MNKSTIINITVSIFLVAVVIGLAIVAWRYYGSNLSPLGPNFSCAAISSVPDMATLSTWEAQFPNVLFTTTHLAGKQYTLTAMDKTTNNNLLSCNITIG